jgi:hypothetical protein
MKWARVTAVLLAFCFVLSPVMVRAQVVASAPLMPVIPEADVQDLINKYIDRFKAMDHESFMSLFSKEAVENRMLPYKDMSDAYWKIFKETSQFLYHVKIDAIHTFTKSAYATAQYQIIQTLNESKEMKVYKGKIQWVFVLEDGSLKILRLNYGNEM